MNTGLLIYTIISCAFIGASVGALGALMNANRFVTTVIGGVISVLNLLAVKLLMGA